jgi:hypothetical protein
MINCIIANELMPKPSLCPHQTSLHCRYAFAVQSFLLETTSLPSHSTIHFIGSVINYDTGTGNVLEYRHLTKTEKQKRIWSCSFANKLGQLF